MYCSNCGNRIDDNDKFCGSCGNELSNVEHTNKIVNESVVNDQEIDKIDNDEFDVFTEKIIWFLRRLKELIVEHKIIFGLCVASFVIICYSIFWTNSLNQAKILCSQGEFVKAKAKVENLFNPFNNKEIEEIIYRGYYTEPLEENLNLTQKTELDEYDYCQILTNIFESIRRMREVKPSHVEYPGNTELQLQLSLIDLAENTYRGDVLKIIDMDKSEQTKHIKQISKNIVAQNKLDAANLETAEKLQKHKIKLYPEFSYEDDEWICRCSMKIDKNSPYKNFEDIEIYVTYYDENYEEIQTDSYVVESAYRGQYIDDIEIISIPKAKTKPFKYRVYTNYFLYY